MLTPQDKKVLEEIHSFLRDLSSPIGLQAQRLQFVKGNADKYRAELERILAKV
jgi:hypothetical protein